MISVAKGLAPDGIEFLTFTTSDAKVGTWIITVVNPLQAIKELMEQVELEDPD